MQDNRKNQESPPSHEERPRARPIKRERAGAAEQPPEGLLDRKLTLEDVKAAYAPLQDRYGPIIFLAEAAEISGHTRGTLLKKVSQGCYPKSAARGRPLRFWRDWFVLEVMSPERHKRPRRSCKPRRETSAAPDPLSPERSENLMGGGTPAVAAREVDDEVR